MQTTAATLVEKLKPDEIAVLILSTQAPQYREFQEAIRNTWKRKLANVGVHVYFYSGDHLQNTIMDDEIHLVTSDKLEATAEKLKGAIRILYNTYPHLKLIYRTNLSSYIEVDNFLKFIAKHHLGRKTYSGVIGKTTYLKEYFYGNRFLHIFFRLIPVGKKIIFASGSGFFLGIDYAKKLIDLEFENELIDDVMVAMALNISPSASISPKRFDVKKDGTHKVSPEVYSKLIEEQLLFHYRFKTNDRKHDATLLALFDEPSVRHNQCTNLK